MSATASLDQLLEFRCNRCWHSNCVSTRLCGESVACASCKAEQLVPEATPERIARAEQVMREQASRPSYAQVEKPYEEMTDAELRKLVKSESYVPSSQRDFPGVELASLLSRLAANFVDGIAIMLAFIVSFLSLALAQATGLIAKELSPGDVAGAIEALCIMGFPIAVFCMVQWNLIATRGQSMGKMLLFIRIVNDRGNPPGFVQGVILRDWVRVLLGLIPFFNIIDILFIFGESRRCIHDFIAGTRVVQA
ncbi:MAG: RDD family protein [Pirellulaceae bacterium]